MRALRSWLGLLGTLALAGLSAPTGAQPVGSEFQINTYTTDSQDRPSVTTDESGNFVVVWESNTQDGAKNGIFGKRYNGSGETLGAEFRVNSFTTGSQSTPSVTSDGSGNFVVVWSSVNQDGSGHGIFGQRYDSAGETLGAEFRVNSHTRSRQRFPSVASDASGNFVVAWQSREQDGSDYGIFGQRYDSGGVAQGGEFRVNSYTTSAQLDPSVASDASGNFVVVWVSDGQDGEFAGVFGQRYDSTGVALGVEFRINSYTIGGQYFPSVASDASGNFVVVWEGNGQDDFHDILGQRYDSEGVPQGNEFRVNSYTTSAQLFPSVASDVSGNFAVAWTGHGFTVHDWIFGQRYDNDGVAQGDEFQVNSYTSSLKFSPSVGAMGTNEFVVVWGSADQDGSNGGVFGQRFDFDDDTIAIVSPNTSVKWRIGSLQRIQWTHNLGVGATFRIELDRDDNGNYEELIAAAAPADSATRGSFTWTVTGPPSAAARVRVSWTDDPSVSDVSDVTFQIRPAALDG